MERFADATVQVKMVEKWNFYLIENPRVIAPFVLFLKLILGPNGMKKICRFLQTITLWEETIQRVEQITGT